MFIMRKLLRNLRRSSEGRPYFPYNAKLCLNGHEYVKRQLAKEGIAFEPLDNGIRSCANPPRLQQICDQLSAAKIDALLRKWLAKLPHPYPAADRKAGYRYDVSILQAEFALTQVLDRPQTGRIFFEEVIRENLDLGRPDQVQLIFERRVSKRTPGRFRTRVLTEGVIPSPTPVGARCFFARGRTTVCYDPAWRRSCRKRPPLIRPC